MKKWPNSLAINNRWDDGVSLVNIPAVVGSSQESHDFSRERFKELQNGTTPSQSMSTVKAMSLATSFSSIKTEKSAVPIVVGLRQVFQRTITLTVSKFLAM